MGVGVGIFKMTNTTTQAVNLANLTEQEIGLCEAYAQSASQDQLVALDFEVTLADGLPCKPESALEIAANHVQVNSRACD